MLVALGVLLWLARGGMPRPVIVAAFIAFILVSTVWVRGQYADSLHGNPRPIPTWLLVLLIAGMAVLFGIFGFGDKRSATVLVVAVVLLYLVAGFLITLARAKLRSPLWGVLASAVGLAGGLLLFLNLGDGPPELILALALVTAFSLPPGVSLLSEWAIDRLGKSGSTAAWSRVAAMIVGALLFAGATWAAYTAADSTWMVVALAALGLLVVALASSTQADIVVVLALIALMGITPLQPRLPAALQPAGREDVLVALGDSYMSGEGAATFYEGTDEGGGNTCRRAPTAWAAMAGQQPPFNGVDFLACSGARTYNIRSEPASTTEDGSSPPPLKEQEHLVPEELDTQLAQYARHKGGYTPSLVVISIGGNDAGFATIGQMCVAPGDCSDKADLWLAGLDEVERELQRTFAEVRTAFRDVPVVVIPYPDPIDRRSDSCGQVALNESEREFIGDFLNALNGRIRAAAAIEHFHYLGAMRNALRDADLQLCDPLNEGRPGVNFIGLRSVNGAADQRFNPLNWSHNSLHPNERGHAAMLRAFQVWHAANPHPAVLAPEDREAPSPEEAARDVPGAANCSVYDEGDNGCRAQGTTWALQRVGDLAFSWGMLLVAAAAAGAWAFAVGLFGWRRSRTDSAGEGPG